jgi:hypothetical protein
VVGSRLDATILYCNQWINSHFPPLKSPYARSYRTSVERLESTWYSLLQNLKFHHNHCEEAH